MMPIKLTRHAEERWREHVHPRTNRQRIKSTVLKHLIPALQVGVKCDPTTGAIHLRISNNIIAVIRPSLLGGWQVITFYIPYELQEKEDKEVLP